MKKFLTLTIIAIIAIIALIGLSVNVNATEVTVATESDLKDALSTDGTVKLSGNIEITESIRTTTNVTVDLNGFKITGPDDGKANWYAFIVEGGTFTLKDSSAAQTGEIYAKCYGVETKGGTFIMESGKITATKNPTLGAAVVNFGGKVEIKGGTLIAAVWAVEAEAYFADAEVVISGGTFETTDAQDYSVAVQIGGSYSEKNETAIIRGGTFKGTNNFAVDSNADVSVTGGAFSSDISDYVSAGYIVNYPVFVDEVEMYEVKLNRPYVTNDRVTDDDTLFGETEIGVVSELQGELESIFEEEIEKNETLKKALLDGKLVNIHVQMDKVEEKDINEEELKAMKEAAKEGKFVKFYDITLVMNADGTQIDTISEISNKLTFKVLVPEELIKDGRTFFMYRYHDGEVKKLTGELDEENYFTFESDKFSTYALAYEDKVDEPTAGGQGTAEKEPEKDETPKTGSIDVTLFASVMVAVVSLAGVVLVKKYTR